MQTDLHLVHLCHPTVTMVTYAIPCSCLQEGKHMDVDPLWPTRKVKLLILEMGRKIGNYLGRNITPEKGSYILTFRDILWI